MNAVRREFLAGQVRDAIAEYLHVAGDHRAASAVVMMPANLLLASQAHDRRHKTPLLQPGFEAGARRRIAGIRADLERFSRTTAARRIDERVARERVA